MPLLAVLVASFIGGIDEAPGASASATVTVQIEQPAEVRFSDGSAQLLSAAPQQAHQEDGVLHLE